MVVEERLPVFLFVGVTVVLILALFGVAYHDEIVRTLPYIPAGTYIEGVFGAKNLPLQLGDMARTASGQAALGNIVCRLLLVKKTAGIFAIGRRFTADGLHAAMEALPRREHNLL